MASTIALRFPATEWRKQVGLLPKCMRIETFEFLDLLFKARRMSKR